MQEQDTDDMTAVKARYGVPHAAEACHTAVVDGYVVEGHVPVDAIRRLLKDRPDVVGIAVAGMPSGTPGMDGPKQAYNIVSFDKTGKITVLERR